MAVKANDNFTFTVKTKKDAVKALEMMQERSEEAQELMREHGITELMQEATELKKAVTNFCIAKGIDKLDLGDSYASLRVDAYDRRWIATADDLSDVDAPHGAKPLQAILKKKFKNKPERRKHLWNRITKRVVDPNTLQEAVDEGLLDEDEIAPAYVEKTKAPYLRIYSKGE